MLQICMMSLSFKMFCPEEKKNPFSLFSRGICAFVVEYSQCIKADSRFHSSTRLVLNCSLFVCLQILSPKPGNELLHGKESQHLSGQTKVPHDYDSGNDTSSPPSSKTGVFQAIVTDNKRNHCKRLASPEKLKFTDRDNASDSGNSVTSYASLCKPYREDSLSATLFSGNGKR